jgi:DNA-binding CsgD family transcriptional regulator
MGKIKPSKHSSNPSKDSVQESVEHKLSSREIEILLLLCEGKRHKEIGDILNISPRTVEAYRGKLKIKLGVRSFPELVRYALRNGIVQA